MSYIRVIVFSLLIIMLFGVDKVLSADTTFTLATEVGSGMITDGSGCTGAGAFQLGWGGGDIYVGLSSAGAGVAARLFMSFNTSRLGASANVSNATIFMFFNNDQGTSNINVSSCDYGTNFSKEDFTTPFVNSIFAFGGVVPSGFLNFTIPSTWINTTGITQIMLKTVVACSDTLDRYVYDTPAPISPRLNITYTNASLGDTCTAPASGNWAISCSDNCAWTTNQNVPGNVSMSGTGTLHLGANFTFTGSNQWININSSCTLEVQRGGAII